MASFLEPLWNWTLDALFPPRCCACARFERSTFCARHAPSAVPILAPFCRVCQTPFDPLAFHDEFCADCRDDNALEVARAAWAYAGAPRAAIHRFKYEGKAALAPRLANAMLAAWQEDATLGALHFDGLCCVPLHPRRQRKRGFNQSLLLARALSRQTQVPTRDLLQRVRATTPQVELSAKERSQNVRGAFALRRGAQVKGQTILLVDDVFTTGSTLRECAHVLRRAGAHSVAALTLARQVSPDLRPLFETPEQEIVFL